MCFIRLATDVNGLLSGFLPRLLGYSIITFERSHLYTTTSFTSFYQIFLPDHSSTSFYPIILSHHSLKSLYQIILPDHSITSFYPIILPRHSIISFYPIILKRHSIRLFYLCSRILSYWWLNKLFSIQKCQIRFKIWY